MARPGAGDHGAEEATLITLPDDLLRGILRRAWADRPARVAAEEVRCAAGLASVCRRWSELLRAPPLPLALDFSAAPLSGAQRRWLLDPAQAGRVEAARFHGRLEADRDALWEQPLLGDFLARHGGTLLRLSGVPHQLVACVSENERPVLDLSGLRLTALGIDCYGVEYRVPWGDPPASMWLWPDRLPGSLEELHLVGLVQSWPGSLAWAQRPSAGWAGRLPRLRILCVTRASGVDPVSIVGVPLLEGFPVLPALEVDVVPAFTTSDVSLVIIDVHCSLFGRARSVHIVACGCLILRDDQEDVAVFVDRLCPAGLQAAELCAEPHCIGLRPSEAQSGHEVVRELISRCGDRFAVEVGVYHARLKSGPGRKGELRRLAWRRWPAPGAPGLPAARAAHERARAWAADL